MDDELITTGEAARLLGARSVNTVKRLIREGRLPATRPGAHYRVRRSDVLRLAAAGRTDEPPDPRSIAPGPIAAWAGEHGVVRLTLFGSAARGQLRPDSDVDLIVELRPGVTLGLLRHARMARELEEIFGRRVDLGLRGSLKPSVRASADRDAVTLYEA